MTDFADRYFPLLAWTVIVVIASWGSWIIVTGREEIPEQATNGTINQPVEEIPPVVVDQPVLEEVTPEGSVRWTLYLDRFVRDEGAIMDLKDPRVIYRLKSDEILEVGGSEGTYDEATGMLVLTGRVKGRARSADFSFDVGNLEWDSFNATLKATGGVEIFREGIKFTGNEFNLDLSDELASLEVSGGVEITSAPSAIKEIGNIN